MTRGSFKTRRVEQTRLSVDIRHWQRSGLRSWVFARALGAVLLVLAACGLPGSAAKAAVVDLGAARDFAILYTGGPEAIFEIGQGATIVGDVGIGPDGLKDLGSFKFESGATVAGNTAGTLPGHIIRDGTFLPMPNMGTFPGGGGFLNENLSTAISDASSANAAVIGMSPDDTFGEIVAPQTLEATGFMSVFKIDGAIKDDVTFDDTLFPGAIFYLIVTGGMQGDITIGGVDPSHVLIAFEGPGDDISPGSGAVVDATIMALMRKVDIAGQVNGAVVAGDDPLTGANLLKVGNVTHMAFVPIPPAILLFLSALGVFGFAFRRKAAMAP